MKVENKNCSHCGKANNECAVFEKKVLLVFTVEVPICQSCVSKAFRSFVKGK
jgi:hypothetical protein